MAGMADRLDDRSRCSSVAASRSVVPAMLLGATAVAVVLVATLLDRAHVDGRTELERVGMAFPLDWLTQRRSIDPPMPYWRGA